MIRGTSRHGNFDNADLANNVLVGGIGSDLLEGRGGADLLVGGSVTVVNDGIDHIVMTSDFSLDFAKLRSSPAGAVVRLAGFGSDTQTAIATGGDAAGDFLMGIEGLIGSRFNDTLTGNSLNNVLAGGLGSDILDGKTGIDTADYSGDHFFDLSLIHDTADKVVVQLGLNGARGTGVEFRQHVILTLPVTVTYEQISTDTLISIENVTGTAGPDTITGNALANVLDGRDGNDTLDGGFGDDTLIGGAGIDTASFISHDAITSVFEVDTITLGLDGATDKQPGCVYPRTAAKDSNCR